MRSTEGRNGGGSAGFSVFLDQIIDESGETHWETRLYHAESGAETTLPGKAPDQWISWILDRMRPAATAGMPPEGAKNRAAVEVASVEILDVTFVGDDAADGESLHTIKAQVVVQLSGLARLEREIGSSVLRRIASRKPQSPIDLTASGCLTRGVLSSSGRLRPVGPEDRTMTVRSFRPRRRSPRRGVGPRSLMPDGSAPGEEDTDDVDHGNGRRTARASTYRPACAT